MRRVLLLLALWAVPAFAVDAATPRRAAHVPWIEDPAWAAVLDQAAAEGRPILIDFHATWCGPCKMLDAYVYNESEVIAELADVITVKLDFDRPENAALRAAFNITLLPTLIWCGSDGREADRFTGFVNKVEFLEIVRAFRTGADSFQRLEVMQARRPESAGLLFDLARRHAERGNEQRAEILYRRLMNLRESDQPQVVVDGMLGLASLRQQAGDPEAARHLARRASAIPGSGGALMAVASFQGALADTAGMLATYEVIISRDDMDFEALHGFARTAAAAGVDLRQASRYAIRAVVLSDNDPRIISTLSECYFKRRLPAKASRWIEKARALDPENEIYKRQSEKYLKAMQQVPSGQRGRRR